MFIAGCDVSDFKKLLVWQKGHALALHAHRVATGIRRRQNVPLSISETDFSQLMREVVEVRKMIHGLLKRSTIVSTTRSSRRRPIGQKLQAKQLPRSTLPASVF